jgi:hypothetical protein
MVLNGPGGGKEKRAEQLGVWSRGTGEAGIVRNKK